PLEVEVEAAKDAVVDGVGEEARLRNLAEALQRRRSEIEGQRRQLDEEQRALGSRLEENARARDGLRGRLAGLTVERDRLESARGAAVSASQASDEEAARQDVACDAARERATQLRSRLESLRELEARYEGCTRGVANLREHDPDGAALLA